MASVDRIPFGGRCTFEEDWCGWYNVKGKTFVWTRHNGSTPTNFTGPNYDHTYLNTTGKYLYVNMLQGNATFASTTILRSVIFNPPPKVHGNSSSTFYNSCAVRSLQWSNYVIPDFFFLLYRLGFIYIRLESIKVRYSCKWLSWDQLIITLLIFCGAILIMVTSGSDKFLFYPILLIGSPFLCFFDFVNLYKFS